MADWTDGYVTDLGYTHGYYAELNPLRARLPLLNAGWMAPDWRLDAPACELGFGQGLSINVHAAAGSAHWMGTDFNPTHAAFAQELARVSGVDPQGRDFSDQAFAEFCQRTDLPDFAFIGVHGIWSWISDENRNVLVDFVRRKLRVGGVLYISYNTQPGWAAMAPMRDLLAEHAQIMGVPGRGMTARINGALAFADQLMACNPHYARTNPQIADQLTRIKGLNRNYLAHEYFNRDWQPMGFSRMAKWLAPAKLGFACSAHYLDHLPALNFTAEQSALLMAQEDAMFRETVRDFIVNQQFRRDYWVKGARRLSTTEQLQALRAVEVTLLTPPADVALTVRAVSGEATLQPGVYKPILDVMDDLMPHSLGTLWRRLQERGYGQAVSFAQLVEAMLLLISKGDVAAVQHPEVVRQATTQARQLNLHLLRLARHRADLPGVACPVTGDLMALNRFEQLFTLAMQESPTEHPVPDAGALATVAWEALQAQGLRLLRDGKPMDDAADNLAELRTQADTYLAKRLPLLRRLGVLD